MGSSTLEVINGRRSTRKFAGDPVGEADIRDPLGLAMNLSLWVLWAILGYKPATES